LLALTGNPICLRLNKTGTKSKQWKVKGQVNISNWLRHKETWLHNAITSCECGYEAKATKRNTNNQTHTLNQDQWKSKWMTVRQPYAISGTSGPSGIETQNVNQIQTVESQRASEYQQLAQTQRNMVS
jgi:hypothetical protein